MKTLKVPQQQFRAAMMTVTGEGKDRKLSMSISSDVPYLRYDFWNDEDYYEILSHAPGDINEERLKAGLPILFNHDRDAHLGRSANFVNDGHKCTLTDISFSESEFAKTKVRDIETGVLKDTSVGYSVDDEGECVGEKDGIPIYKFGWTPFEGSLVTVPADISVGVGREREQPKPNGDPREILIIEKKFDRSIKPPQNEEHSNPTMETPEEKSAREQKEKEQQTANRKAIADGMKAAKEREKEIRAIAKRAKNLPGEVLEKALDDALENENAIENFRKLVFEKYWGDAQPLETPVGEGGGSGIEVIGARGTIGAQFVRSPEVIALGGKLKRGQAVSVEMPGRSFIGARGKASMQARAGFTSSDLAAVNVTIAPGILALGVQRLTVMDVIGSGTIGTGVYRYARENGFGTIDGVAVAAGAMPRAKAVGERGVKPNWDADLSTEIANVSKVAITTKVPDEFLADFPSAQSYIDERLPFMVDTETEFQILYGDGLNNNVKGIFSTGGVQTRAVTATDDSTKAASIRQGLTDIQVGAQFEPDFIGFHPYDWETASLLKDSTGRFLAGGPFYIPYTGGTFVELHTFWGKPVVVTTAITYGKPIAGAGKIGAAALIREGMRIEMTNANEDDFKRNLICLRAEHRLAVPVYRPVAFLEFTGWPART